MSNAPTAELAGRTSGRVWAAVAPDREGYDRERSGFNLALDHRPGLVLAAVTVADMVEGVRFASEYGLPVDIQATGHGAHQPMDEGLLITTRHLTGVQVDPQRQVANVAAGATAAESSPRRRRTGWPRPSAPHPASATSLTASAAAWGHSVEAPATPPTTSDAWTSSPPRAPNAPSPPTTIRSCSGRCAAAAATSPPSPASRSTCCRSRTSTAAACTSPATARPMCWRFSVAVSPPRRPS